MSSANAGEWTRHDVIGPNGEKRPGDSIANALRVAKIATGEVEEEYVDESKRPGGRAGGRARADALTPEQRRAISRKGAETAARNRKRVG
jgi:hypothetical protein